MDGLHEFSGKYGTTVGFIPIGNGICLLDSSSFPNYLETFHRSKKVFTSCKVALPLASERVNSWANSSSV